ncbi:hypothetical protein [Pelobium manganitolerans]|uniref:hypothetical protein n=1 Tax=Pelobium manganitolerans TaxID=1842495 RepID=UPI003FA389EE
MKKLNDMKQLYTFLICLFIAGTFVSCEKDEPAEICDFELELAVLQKKYDEFEKLPNKQNCNAFKSYALDLTKKMKKCSSVDKSRVADIEELLEYMDCNEF